MPNTYRQRLAPVTLGTTLGCDVWPRHDTAWQEA